MDFSTIDRQDPEYVDLLKRVLEEEAGHIDYATTRTAEMAMRGGELKERVQQSVNRWYVIALDMFGRTGSPRSERFAYWGLKRRSKRGGSRPVHGRGWPAH